MQALAGIADQRGEPLFDVEVDIFGVEIPGEFALFDLVGDLRHAGLDLAQILSPDDALCGQHSGMGQ